MSQRASNSMPMSRSIHGNAFSWPIATSTSSHGIWVCGSPVGTRLRRPRSSYLASTFSNSTPVSLPLSWVNSTGTSMLRIGMPSCVASSFSQGEAFISSKPRAHHDGDFLAAEPARRAAAIHRGVAAAEYDDATADLVDMAERDATTASRCRYGYGRRLPGGPECRVRARAARRSRQTPRPTLGEQCLEAIDIFPEARSRRPCRGCGRPPRR